MKLFFRTHNTSKTKNVIILHGLYGASDNWVRIAKGINQDYSVYLPDHRNHGNSPHSNEFNYDVLVEDLNNFINENKIENPILIGHSMGGKVAMNYNNKYAKKLKKLIIIDIAPKNYSNKIKTDFHKQILETISQLDLTNYKNRAELKDEVEKLVSEKRHLHLILKNIRRTETAFEWKMNIKAISAELNNILNETFTNKLTSTISKIETLFIKGENSDYLQEEDFNIIRRIYPNAQFVTIENSTHWLHAEQPEMLITKINAFIKE